ncbi:MAG TPA: hypothetical protein DDZ88_20335, partial [Verrucomicrobiales bacterium]|nr:hypothetical protein [Verrucomicrobiales bacterium]
MVYERPPEVWKEQELSEDKRRFVVTYPQVTAPTPGQARRIEEALNFSQLEINLDEEIHQSSWLDEMGFEVDYLQHGLLSATLWAAGSGAYPSGHRKRMVVELASGRRLKAGHVFADLPGLAAKLQAMRESEIREALSEIAENPEGLDALEVESIREQLRDAEPFSEETLNDYELSQHGIIFHLGYGFPHAIQSQEPGGLFTLTWQELRAHLQKEGPLARMFCAVKQKQEAAFSISIRRQKNGRFAVLSG